MKNLLSVWLVPETKDKKYLQEIIDKLSVENQSPSFTPHLTLFGDLEIEEDKLIEIVDKVFEKIKPFEIRKTNISESDYFFKTVFIEFEKDHKLIDLFNEISRSVGERNIDSFKPHISLIYKEIDFEKRKEIIKNLDLKDIYKIGSVFINAPKIGEKDFYDVSSWRKIYEKKLNDQSS